jgi:2-deoxy-D-gluconate 3-dehydrogenase
VTDWGPFSLNEKNAVITGGAMGIGRGIAVRFLEAGANVLIADIDGAAAEQTAAELAVASTGRCVALQIDVALDSAGEDLTKHMASEFGSVDILVNNAGIYPVQPMLEMPIATFERVQSLNVRAVAYCSQGAAHQMIAEGSGGSIINLASIDGIHPTFVGLGAYNASKGAVIMLTKALALELGPHGIRVNAIAPGGIKTPGTDMLRKDMRSGERNLAAATFSKRIPLGRQGAPDDIATVAVFLASDAAQYVTGDTIVADGGFLLS